MAAREEMAAISEADESDSSNKTTGEETQTTAAPVQSVASQKLVRLPISRVKALMKSDPDVSLASQEAVFIISKATVRLGRRVVCDCACIRF